jgi:hypothetical protein
MVDEAPKALDGRFDEICLTLGADRGDDLRGSCGNKGRVPRSAPCAFSQLPSRSVTPQKFSRSVSCRFLGAFAEFCRLTMPFTSLG